MTLRWDVGINTGIDSIDNEHQSFLDEVRAMTERPRESMTLEQALQLLAFLEHHVLSHFFEEEEAMAAAHYPDLERHRAEHEKLTEYITTLRQEITASGPDADLLIISNQLLCNWLLSHINTSDRAFAHHLRNR